MNPGNKNAYVQYAGRGLPWEGLSWPCTCCAFSRWLWRRDGPAGMAHHWPVLSHQPSLRLAVTATAAFLPQFLFITAAVNNDNAMTFLGRWRCMSCCSGCAGQPLRLGGGAPRGRPYKGAVAADGEGGHEGRPYRVRSEGMERATHAYHIGMWHGRPYGGMGGVSVWAGQRWGAFWAWLCWPVERPGAAPLCGLVIALGPGTGVHGATSGTPACASPCLCWPGRLVVRAQPGAIR